MGAENIEAVLSYRALSQPITAVRPGIPDPVAAFRGMKERYRGKGAEAVVIKGTRKTARRAEYGSPATRVVQLGIDTKRMIMLHSFEELEPFDWLVLQRLRSYDKWEATGAEREVTRQMEAFGARQDNLEIAATAQTVFQGVLYFDKDGNLLPNSSGAFLTIDLGVPAGNKNQIGGLISVSWATTSTDISAQLRAIKRAIKQATGYDLTEAYYGINIPSYLFNNTTLQNYFVRNPEMNQRYIASEELGRGLGFNWHPIYDAFYEDNAGTIQQLSLDDMVVLTPPPSKDWWEFAQGSYGVPRSFGPSMELAAALGQIEEVWGRFGWAMPIGNPPGAVAFGGNTFFPWLKLGTVVVQCDVTP